MTEWNQILHEKAYSSEEPDDAIVNIADSLQKKATKSRILDLACGAGRHVIYMADQGFETHGADISDTGLRLTRERLRKRRLTANLVKCDMTHLPYIDSCFDVVICMRAIYHQRLAGIQNTLSEIYRVLTQDGFALTDLLTKRTYSYGKGTEIEKGTFAETEGPEEGILHHFADKQEINRLFRVFKTIDLTLREREVDGKLRSRWAVQAAK
jgi:ubiquinone/menaquinone biosynthesis C-methylase UbiE